MSALLVTWAVSHHSLGYLIDRWDTKWFLRAAANGYPSKLPMIHGHVAGNTIAFFPALPFAIRGLSHLTGMTLFAAGTFISSFTGMTAMIAVWLLAKEYGGRTVADRATLVLALFPGSFVISLIYSEGIAITFVAFGLLALLRRKWLIAGLCGLVATATAPITLAFVLSCVVVSGRAILKDRDWKSLAAPVVAPLGFVAYFVWTWRHTGNYSAWRLTERGGWHSFLSLSYPFRIVGSFIAHPFTSNGTQNLLVVCILLAV